MRRMRTNGNIEANGNVFCLTGRSPRDNIDVLGDKPVLVKVSSPGRIEMIWILTNRLVSSGCWAH